MSRTESEETAETNCQSEDLLDADTRRRYEVACSFFEKQLISIARAVSDSECLTKDDFAIRINAR